MERTRARIDEARAARGEHLTNGQFMACHFESLPPSSSQTGAQRYLERVQTQGNAEDDVMNVRDEDIGKETLLQAATKQARKTLAEARAVKDEYCVTREFEQLPPGFVQFQETQRNVEDPALD
jgi:hypothetical protein